MDPNVTVGPLAISRQKDKLLKQIRKSIDRDGGSLAYGNLDYEHSDPLLKNGNFVEPMVVEGIRLPHNANVFSVSILWGPICLLSTNCFRSTFVW